MSEEDKTRLINLHIAEYQALTTRCTYQLTLHVAMIGLIPVYLTAMVLVWTNSPIDRRLSFWGGMLILECIGLIYLHIQGEQYVAILYVERILRPAATEIVTPAEFWCYESFLAHKRGSRSNLQFIPALWEFPIAVIGTLLILVVLGYAYQHGNSVILSGYLGGTGFILYLLFLILLWWKTITVRKIRLEFSNAALNSGCRTSASECQ